MASRASKPLSHLFVSASGRVLPRWEEAFPRLECVMPGSKPAGLDPTTLVWLRLNPDAKPLEQVEALLALAPGSMLVVLADQPDDDQALPLFSAGIRAYINTHATAANLRQVAQVVRAGGLWIGPGLMKRLVQATSRALAAASPAAPSQPAPRLSALTQRELEVAKLISGGASNKEVARALDISERTVKAHAAAIFEKLGARDRLHLVLIMNGHEPAPAAASVASGGSDTGKKTTKAAAGGPAGSAMRKIAAAGH